MFLGQTRVGVNLLGLLHGRTDRASDAWHDSREQRWIRAHLGSDTRQATYGVSEAAPHHERLDLSLLERFEQFLPQLRLCQG